MSLQVSAIVVSYNSADRIADAVASIEKALSPLDSEVLVVDNASTDNSVELAHGVMTRGRVIEAGENLGYGSAVNLALRHARGEYVLILNDDVLVTFETVSELLLALNSSEEVALAGPRIVAPDGSPMPAARDTYPGLGEEVGRFVQRRSLQDRARAYPWEGKHQDVAWLVGACIAAKAAILREIGGFNPAFFLYGEDIDLARRMQARGYRVVTVPSAVCVHTGSVSTTAAFSIDQRVRRRAVARALFLRIWASRPYRSLVHLSRAIGLRYQPFRLMFHLPKALWDGPSLHHLRTLAPLDAPHPEVDHHEQGHN